MMTLADTMHNHNVFRNLIDGITRTTWTEYELVDFIAHMHKILKEYPLGDKERKSMEQTLELAELMLKFKQAN